MIDLVCTNTIDCKQGAVRAVRFNVDGSYCLTCGADKKVKLWNPYKGLLLKTYGGHGQEVMDACGSCDSSQIASCSKDKTMILWDVSTGQPMRRLRDHAAGITCVKYNEESTLVLSGGLDNTVRLWDIKSRSQEPVQVLREAKDCISALLVTDFEIITASVDGFCRRYDLRNGSCYADFVGASITSIAITHDGQCILVSSSDNKMRLMDKTTGEMLGEYMGHKTNNLNIDCGVITSDDYVLSGSTSGDLFCWDLVTGKVAQKYPHTKNKVLNSLTVHPNKSFVITACVNSVKVWETPGEIVKKAEEG